MTAAKVNNYIKMDSIMAKNEYIDAVPEDIDNLKILANNKSSYKLRNEAIDILEKYKCRQSIDILWRLMMNDRVYSVQHKAFLALQNFGEQVHLPRKRKGHLVKDINKKLGVVQRAFNDSEYSPNEFLEKFKSMYPEAYDIYSYEKGTKMQSWVINTLNSLPKK